MPDLPTNQSDLPINAPPPGASYRWSAFWMRPYTGTTEPYFLWEAHWHNGSLTIVPHTGGSPISSIQVRTDTVAVARKFMCRLGATPEALMVCEQVIP